MDKLQQLARLSREHGIALVYLFGSQEEAGLELLRGQAVNLDDPLTDIDLGVVFSSPFDPSEPHHEQYSRVLADLAGLFLPHQLDLVFLQENHSVFQAEALKGTCVYSADEATRDSYEEMILRRAADFRPFLEKYYEELLAEV